jgi:glycerophosphoryl diester phosphodiesterase
VGFQLQAHRGNSSLALQQHLAATPDAVEVDVGLTRDGTLLLAHEPDMSDATGLTLESALEIAAKTPLVVEAKCFPPDTAPPVAFAVALLPYLDRISVISFDERVLIEVRKRRSRTPTTILFAEPLRNATIASTLGPHHALVDRELVHAAHRLGMHVVPWTVNDATDMAALIDLGVDGFCTDHPALARDVIAERLSLAA